MYEMIMNGKTFFAPANEKYTFTTLELHEALNDAGYIDAMVPSTNPLYDEIEALKSKVVLYKDNNPIFSGLITEVTTDFNKQKTLYIVGELSYLNDSIQLQQNRTGFSKAQLLDVLLKAHNSQSNEKFYPGKVEVSGAILNGLIDFGYTLDIIKNYICSDDGYIKIINRNGRREVDILPIEDYGKQSKQYIRFASNLLDYSEKISSDGITTAILPLGARKDTSEIEGLDSYLDISSVNSGSKILSNLSAVNNYGYRCRVVNFDTDDVNELLKLAKAYLTNYQFASTTLELSAVDLSMLDSSQDDYDVGDYVRCTAEPFDMDRWFPVRQKDTNILDLSQNRIIMGATRTSSLTQSTSSGFTSIQAQLPQQNSILESAKNNATQLIVRATTGYVTTRPDEITIADNKELAKAVKLWRWNMGGLGYSKDGGKTFGTAITMDGSIVADYITTGTMRSVRIENGMKADGTPPFYVTADGRLYAESGTFKGDVSAASLGGGAGQTLQQAINTANQAIQTAQSAAQTAQQAAQSAQSTAQQAQSTATTANNAAATANTAASTAQSAAKTAQSVANTAKKTADGASTQINSLVSGNVTANHIKTTAATIAGGLYFRGRAVTTYTDINKRTFLILGGEVN